MTEEQKQVKEWLKQLRYIRDEQRLLSKAKQEAWDDATKITADLTGMPGSPSKNPHKFERYAELDGNLSELLEKKQEIMTEIVSAINQVEDNKLRLLLTARYINCMPWDEVSQLIGYASSLESDMVFRLHREALDSVSAIINNADSIGNPRGLRGESERTP